MIKIEKTETFGWEAAIRGARNPLNSWSRMDSKMKDYVLENEELAPGVEATVAKLTEPYISIGTKDHDLMMRLRNAGTDHRKFMRMITVYTDITAPLYWWKEFDTYKVGTVANSCSTMHKIQAKEFTIDDFSCEHLFTALDALSETLRRPGSLAKDPAFAATDVEGRICYYTPKTFLRMTCDVLNYYRDKFNETKDKDYWWQMIQLLPSSYNQKRTVMLNYEVLANQYASRKNHKLDEWHDYCDWIKTLPYSEFITGNWKGELK